MQIPTVIFSSIGLIVSTIGLIVSTIGLIFHHLGVFLSKSDPFVFVLRRSNVGYMRNPHHIPSILYLGNRLDHFYNFRLRI